MSGWSNERSAAGDRNPWLIVGVISLATFMEVLDTSIANVSLDHIAGGLAASRDEATWVLTSYLVSNAIVIPISGWLSDVIGRKRYYMISVALFTLSSLMCGFAPNLTFLIIARVLQGIGGGGLAPSEQSFLADSFPPEKRGAAFAAYGVVVVVGPVLGPTLGGIITDNISWHWIFLINVPIGILSLLLVNTLVVEPEILQKERRQRLKRGLRVDYIGFALVVLGLGGLELILDRGEREMWLESTFILGLAVTVVVSLGFLVWWELARKDPIVNLKLLANRNFAITLLFMTTTGAVLFGTTTLIPQMLQEVFNYDATTAGLALTVGGIATLVAMPVVGALTGKVDTRFLLMPALLLQAASLWYMSGWNSELTFHQASTARLISAVGLPFLFVPINTAAYVGLKPDQTSDASALLNVARNLGGSVGIGVAQALLIARGQYHQDRIVEGLNPLNPSYVEGVNQLSRSMPGTGESTATLSALMQQVREQAQVLSYIDVFHGFMIFVLLVTPLAIFLRQGKAKGAAA
ncbi:DHA2 family efflux MFS transporter permease subunit [Sphingomonas sp. RHCKR47]|uniref:DHA2 family efflux MFS transporter permease subunit n=1 Tax=Sphingomonas citricola TaxID=2862498 RepID=UPI001CA4C421|nr:DHA2 family efflux MFS transporter permease subunit [Sphingomonas citricola]MBW6524738.1 DHA2 family efflux MFS transporter permease subunit [Sphingomonas citricola]